MKKIVVSVLVLMLPCTIQILAQNTQNKMIDNGVTMKKGQLWKVDNGEKTKMNTGMTLDNGSRVMTNGKVILKDGRTRRLREGESIDRNGRWTNKMGEEDISKQDRNDMRNTNNDMLNNRKKNNRTNKNR